MTSISTLTVVQAGLALALATPLFSQGFQTLSVSAKMDIWQSGATRTAAAGSRQHGITVQPSSPAAKTGA